VDTELRLQLSEEGTDAERLAVLTGYVRSELLQLDVEDVRALPAGEPPPGTRAFGVDTVGALLIALSGFSALTILKLWPSGITSPSHLSAPVKDAQIGTANRPGLSPPPASK
jgi:hypothetical protein